MNRLAAVIDGELLRDETSRRLYATDASPYETLPLAIVRPRHRNDCIALVEWACERKIPLIPRAAGTSLAGQCVGDGLIVDIARHMNALIDIDPDRRRARVQPGLVLDRLNAALRPLGMMFAPDPSTGSRCTVGGMMGNNAWGIHAPRYGATRDHIVAVDAVLGDGSTARFAPLDTNALEQTRLREDRSGLVTRRVFDLVDRDHAAILKRFPAPDGIERNAGFALDRLARARPWQPAGPPFNIASLLCGSEGTLALATEIELDLVPIRHYRRLLCAHFHSVHEALQAVAVVMPWQPAAVELLDRTLLELTRTSPTQRHNRFWLEGTPAAVLLIELDDDSSGPAQALATELITSGLGYSHPVLEPPLIERAWALRKAGLGLLMGKPGPLQAVTGIEDGAVAVADLPAYLQDIEAMLMRHGIDCVVYGPAGRGCLHLRPLLNLGAAGGRDAFAAILSETADIVIRHGGTLSAKHGDGRLRAPFLERLLGAEMIGLMRQIKAVFDPNGILNPGTILDPPPTDRDLRNKPAATALAEPVLRWPTDGGLAAAVQKCNGAAVCLKAPGHGAMCPSYMASREEKDSTRGRANLLRQALASNRGAGGWNTAGLWESLDRCLACKSCRSECPASIDMARMKAELLQQRHRTTGVPLRAQAVARFDRLSHWGSRWPGLANAPLVQRWVKAILGFHHDRPLPTLAATRFSRHHRPPSASVPPNLLLIIDPFSEYYEPAIAGAAVRVLQACGQRVQVSPTLALGRAEISQGLLLRARERISRFIQMLYPFAAAGRPIVGLEPSELLTLRDEAIDLVEGDQLRHQAHTVAAHAVLFDEFIARHFSGTSNRPFVRNNLPKTLLLHGHCHQKASVGMQPTIDALALIPDIDIHTIDSGCCGLAGIFGFEKAHYRLSMEIAEQTLLPCLREAPDPKLVVTSGASCRQQIGHGAGLQAWHPAQVLARALPHREAGMNRAL